MPSVGIFWVLGRGGDDRRVLADLKPVDEAEVYGEFRTHGAHYQFWDALGTLSAGELRLRKLPTEPLWTEYEDHPRGRVVFHIPSGKFTIYADRKLWRPATMSRIVHAFGLDNESFEVRPDAHYVSGPPK